MISGWTTILIATGVVAFNLVCIALTVLQLPGLWLMLLAALLVRLLVDPAMFEWKTLGIAAGITIAAEIAEMAAGAIGAKSQGASKRAVWGAVGGGIVGAIAGTFFIPIPVVGTLIGAALGSGIAAAGLELTMDGREHGKALRVGGGAAAGRLAASVLKLGFAFACALVLSIAAFIA